MKDQNLKAVIFDIGGVVVDSPLIAIAEYEKQHGIPPNYINCSLVARGHDGAWQKFERGEMNLFPFYENFGKELSDTKNGNVWYAAYCKRRGLECPELPESLNIDGRELFGQMMRRSKRYDEKVVEAIHRIRATKRWRIIALTNNFSKDIIGDVPPDFDIQSELRFLGWDEGSVPAHTRNLFDDFVNSSEVGMRKPDPAFYLLACERNNIQPQEAVFLDDLGLNLKAAQELGMKTIHVPIGGSLNALRKLEDILGVDLTSGEQRSKL